MFMQRSTHALLNLARPWNVVFLDLINVSGHLDARDSRISRRLLRLPSGHNRLHTIAVHVPFGEAAIRWQATMQVTRRGSVLIEHEASHNRAQALHIEIRVLDFERIESPFDQANAAANRILSLGELQHPPHPVIAIILQDAEHVAVEINLLGRLDSWNRQAESDHAGAIERAKRLPAYLGRGDEQTYRQQLDLFESPDSLLELHGFREFGVLRQWMDLNHSPRRFASCQSDSMSSMFDSRSEVPRSSSPASTCAKRRRNFALVLRNACSGSTFRKRAMFTRTNSRSPISPSTSSTDPAFRAASNSASSSCSLSTTCSTFGQSNPAPAARDAICCASTKAGVERVTPASRPFGLCSGFSSALISSQRFFTSSAVRASPSANTVGCRRINFELIACSESAMSNFPSSAAMVARNTGWSSRSPSSSASPSQSRP